LTTPGTSTAITSTPKAGGMIDPRGPRFGAVITTVVVAVTLVTSSGWLALAQTVVFGIGALAGLRYAPYGTIYRTLVQPRLPKPTELEDPAPPRFAQACGFFFMAVGTAGYLAGVPVLGAVATALALAAAFLNAAFNYCIGCEVYLLFRRSTTAH
jgi:hypothetical protein